MSALMRGHQPPPTVPSYLRFISGCLTCHHVCCWSPFQRSDFGAVKPPILITFLVPVHSEESELKGSWQISFSQVPSGHPDLRCCSSSIHFAVLFSSSVHFAAQLHSHHLCAECEREYLHTLWFLGLRVVKLAEIDEAARHFSWLQHSSPDEGWIPTKPAALRSGPDSLFVPLLPSFVYWGSPSTFTSCPAVFLCPCRKHHDDHRGEHVKRSPGFLFKGWFLMFLLIS